MSTSNQSNSSNRKSYKIATIPGDGIGPDVISAGIKTLESTYYKNHGKYLPDDALEIVREFEAVFFGSAGSYISLGFETSSLPTIETICKCHAYEDFERENSEGEYAGHGGSSHKGEKWAVATETSIFTRVRVDRIMRFAFETARGRKRKHLTVVTKSNAQRNEMVFWDEVAEEVEETMNTKMVLQPRSIDTIVATNLHADILSDLAAALAGSIGIAPTSNLDPTRNNPSMFEPIHGSAFDLVGKGVANPVGTLWSAAEMLRWLGEGYAADLLMDSVENVLESGVKTLDLGGQAKTHEVVDAVFAETEVVVRKTKGS
ncbi:hypothetical protein EYC80_001818 [Monilinia laxa]|uniref:Isopropylmalate dehydrogenase-like domain-containing protein n=1 Tax=Monilinia laxa TaxID=61186 RepID=A0A5N6K680_MONLA|nr:hypothetical protein EYC80_001818 [Monilinia laxa]